jgi:hypothetical protein
MSIINFPTGVIESLIDFLGWGSGIMFGRTCKSFNALVKSRYKVTNRSQIIHPIDCQFLDVCPKFEIEETMLYIRIPQESTVSDFLQKLYNAEDLRTKFKNIIRIRVVLLQDNYRDGEFMSLIYQLCQCFANLKKLEVALLFHDRQLEIRLSGLKLEYLVFYVRKYEGTSESTPVIVIRLRLLSGVMKKIIFLTRDNTMIPYVPTEFLVGSRLIIKDLDNLDKNENDLDLNDYFQLLKI